MSEKWPAYYSQIRFHNPNIEKISHYITRKTYKDGVRVIINSLSDGDITTYFPDGSIHREYQSKGEDRYSPPKKPA